MESYLVFSFNTPHTHPRATELSIIVKVTRPSLSTPSFLN
jgi:hypothetical protein